MMYRWRIPTAAAVIVVLLDVLSGCEIPGSADHGPALLDVTGKPADSAEASLQAAGYRVAAVGSHGDPVAPSPRRLVIEQQPPAGEKTLPGELVILTLGPLP